MQTNKNRKLRNDVIRLVCSDIVLLAVASGFFYLFSKSFFTSLSRDQVPIGTVTYKYRVAQRKFSDRMLWDRIKQQSELYNGDTLRTAADSSATITFTDGNIMELRENTMAQVFKSKQDDKMSALVSNGSASFDTSAATAGMSITTGRTNIALEQGATVITDVNEDVAVQVVSGTAQVTADGNEHTIAQGDALSVLTDGTVQVRPVVVVSPVPDQKILTPSQQPVPVTLQWKTNNLDSTEPIIVEASPTKSFTLITQQQTVIDTQTLTVSLAPGTMYYRVYPKTIGTQVAATGKVQVLYTPQTQLIAPSPNHEITYRTKLPSVRFIWEQNQWAAAYQLEVADNPAMTNPVLEQRTSFPSSIVSTLASGTWYWRVTPFYSMNKLGLGEPSSVQSFSIVQTQEMNVPIIQQPADNGIVNLDDEKGVRFTWRNGEDASYYTLRIADNPELESPKVMVQVKTNFWVLHKNEYALDEGKWYWGITQTDKEGNESALSEVHAIATARGVIEQRTIYPPDGFSVYGPLVAEIPFSWKSSVPGPYRLQIAAKPDFNTLTKDIDTNNLSAYCSNLPVGSWYWRVVSQAGDTPYYTEPKLFRVVPDLPPPVPIAPINAASLTSIDDTIVNISWEKVIGAEYYTFKLYKEGSGTRPIDTKNFYTDTSVSYDVGEFAEGNYYWTIQAFAEESDTATRRVGAVGSYSFSYKHLHRIRMVAPAPDTRMSGVAAKAQPSVITWDYINRPRTATAYISRNANPTIRPVAKIALEQGKQARFPKLEPGSYYWTIKATSFEGVDMSAPGVYSFVVQEAASLQQAVITGPEPDALYDVMSLSRGERITFAWKKVPEATSYDLVVRDAQTQKVLLNKTIKGTSYKASELTFTQECECLWSVTPYNRMKDGTELQHGPASQSSFTIVPIPLLPSPDVVSPGTAFTVDEPFMRRNDSLTLSWKAVPDVSEYELLVSNVADGSTLVHTRLTQNQYVIKSLSRLPQNRYNWSVTAYKHSKIAEQNQHSRTVQASFEIVRPRPLSEATLVLPQDGQSFDASYFAALHQQGKPLVIPFEWKNVPDADEYVVTLTAANGDVLYTKTLQQNRHVLEDLTVLRKGTITCTVHAQNYTKDGLVYQTSIVQGTFKVDLQTKSKKTIRQSGAMYGQ